MKKNILVAILEYGKEQLHKDLDSSLDDLRKHLSGQYSDEFIDIALNEFLKDNFDELDGPAYRINSEGYFRLLNQENLAAAKSGIKVAIILGIISFVISLGSIVVAIIPLLKDNVVQIDKNQYESIQKHLIEIEKQKAVILLPAKENTIKPVTKPLKPSGS
jgi:hypothetical protein